eukprot:3120471-Rhodomonas_salina.2
MWYSKSTSLTYCATAANLLAPSMAKATWAVGTDTGMPYFPKWYWKPQARPRLKSSPRPSST